MNALNDHFLLSVIMLYRCIHSIYVYIFLAPLTPPIPQISRTTDTTIGIEIQQAHDGNHHIK